MTEEQTQAQAKAIEGAIQQMVNKGEEECSQVTQRIVTVYNALKDNEVLEKILPGGSEVNLRRDRIDYAMKIVDMAILNIP